LFEFETALSDDRINTPTLLEIIQKAGTEPFIIALNKEEDHKGTVTHKDFYSLGGQLQTRVDENNNIERFIEFELVGQHQKKFNPFEIPEPTSTLGLLAIGTLGAASTLKRKLKPSKSTEKESTKVS
jgi:hypothetical protein